MKYTRTKQTVSKEIHGTVTVYNTVTNTVKQLDSKESNKIISDKDCVYNNSYERFMHRFTRAYTLS